jgi:arsenate reductase
VEIRAASSEELEAVQSLLREAGLAPLEASFHLRDLIVASEDSRVVGAGALEVRGRTGLLRAVVVAPDRRGRGIGSELFRSLRSRAYELSLRELLLLTLDAQPFFRELGFVEVPRDGVPSAIRARRLFREHHPDSAVPMRLSLV